jgi:hypothetical protein
VQRTHVVFALFAERRKVAYANTLACDQLLERGVPAQVALVIRVKLCAVVVRSNVARLLESAAAPWKPNGAAATPRWTQTA